MIGRRPRTDERRTRMVRFVPRKPTAALITLVSSHRVLCDALRRVLAKERRIRVLQHVMSLNEIAKACREDPGLVVVCDGSSQAALRFLQTASRRLMRCRVVVFGLRTVREYRRLCTSLRAQGLVSREASLKELVIAIHLVRRGGVFVSPMLGAELARGTMSASRAISRAILTEREGHVADLLAHSLTNREIAGRLQISENTVRVHVSHILKKLQARDRGEAASVISRSERAAVPSMLLGGREERPAERRHAKQRNTGREVLRAD